MNYKQARVPGKENEDSSVLQKAQEQLWGQASHKLVGGGLFFRK